MRIRFRTFLIVLLVLSSLWMVAVYGPLLYGLFFGPQDLQAILHALENRGVAPPAAAAIVRQAITAAGPLQRAIPVGYFRGGSFTTKLGQTHSESRVQTTYIAWFQRLPKPILLILERKHSDNRPETYQIDEGEPMSLLRALLVPVVVFVFSILAVRFTKPKAESSPVSGVAT